MKGFGFEAPSGENDHNDILGSGLDDDDCTHCHKYLTVQCQHIDEFINNEV